MSDWLIQLAPAAALAYAVLGGVFLAFSDFLMRAMRVAAGSAGPRVMQAINREVFRYVCIPLFLTMTPLSLGLAIAAAATLDDPTAFIAAAALYLIGCFGVTAARNVPMNDALAALDAGSETGLAYWRDVYLPRWTFWNSVRTAACLLAAAVMAAAVP